MKPQNGTIIAVRKQLDNKSESGLIIGESATPYYSVAFLNENYPEYEVGAKLLSKAMGVKATIDRVEYYFLNAEDILAIL